MNQEFVGRRRELALIEAELAKSKMSLIIAYGRRRVGKSRLLREATKDRTRVLYQATRVTSGLNLESFKREIAGSLGGSPVLEGLSDWEPVFHYLADCAANAHPGLTVVIDEFPYIADADRALPSILQRFIDSGAPQRGNLKLILCGSAISQMEELFVERSPLYGRKTMTLAVKPLPLRDATRFFPDYGVEDKLKAYAVFGGIPFYLQLCDRDVSLRDNITRLLLTETGALVD
ncbi:MAG: ATP-binding protein, partial [Methylocystaceae bacterium]